MSRESDRVDSRDILEEIGSELRRSRAEGDGQIILRMRALVKLRSYEAYALNPNGRYEGPEGRVNEIHLSRELRDKLKDLRSACYRENEGTWFSARIEVAEFGNLAAEFNYDDEPEWDAPPDPVAYVNDFEVFPRDEAHQPEWLKKQLAEGNKKIARHIARGGKR